jgi:hypothetical protein
LKSQPTDNPRTNSPQLAISTKKKKKKKKRKTTQPTDKAIIYSTTKTCDIQKPQVTIKEEET